MQVTEKTKFADYAPFFEYMEQHSKDELKSAAERKYGSPWGITIGQFFDCTERDFSLIGVDLDNPQELTVIQYAWMESFKDMCESFTKALEGLSLPQTPDARKASASCRKMTFRESVLVFCREYFGLHSFNSVYSLTIEDFLLAKKDAYNHAVFEKSMADIQSTKYKSKK